MKVNRKYRWDIILIAAFLAAGIVLALILLLGSKKGNMAEIRVDGTVVETYPLNRDGEYTIEGVDGGSNILRIKDGQVWMEDASCPDLLCVHMGKIEKVGQSIVCLPNRVVVEIISGDGSEAPEVDVIVGLGE